MFKTMKTKYTEMPELYKNIIKVLLFIFYIFLVHISLYYYLYRWFISVSENNAKLIYKDKNIEKVINEKKYNVSLLLYKQTSKDYSNLSKIFLSYLENKNKINYNINISLKKEGISQINTLLKSNIFNENTDNKISFITKSTNENLSDFFINWIFNNNDFFINWVYNSKNNSIIITDLKLNWLLTLINKTWYDNYIKDWFIINYSELKNKEIIINSLLLEKILDLSISERNREDIENIINGIEEYFKIKENQSEFALSINNDLLKTVKTYIINNKNIWTWTKQRLVTDISEIIEKLNWSDFFINRNIFHIKNNNSIFFFDFDFKLEKSEFSKWWNISNEKIETDFIYSIDEITKIFLTKNKLLVKYLNWDDLIFLVK